MAWFKILGITAAICILFYQICRYRMNKLYNEIDEILDAAIAEDRQFVYDVAVESRSSKLANKAINLVKTVDNEITRVRTEKASIQSFVSDMSHQMKTPLASVAMYTDLLIEESILGEQKLEFLLRMKSSISKLQWMMDSLMKISRLEVGAITLQPVGISINQTLADSIGVVYCIAQKRNINFNVIDSDDVIVLHDRKWTAEAIVNILDNAIKYGDSDCEITITIEPLSLYTKVSITNRGMGINKSEWNAIFNRFYRGKNAVDYEGVGLGLYLTKLIIENQHGYILVDSVQGQYTTFSLLLQNC